MNIPKKIIYILFFVLLSPFFVYFIILYQSKLNAGFSLHPLEKFKGIEPIIENYLFYGSILVTIALILLFFIILLFPKKKKSIIFETDSGYLNISYEALIGLLQSILYQNNIIPDKIILKFKKEKINIIIYVNLNYTERSLVQNYEKLSTEISNDFTTCLGINNVEKIFFRFEEKKEIKKKKKVI